MSAGQSDPSWALSSWRNAIYSRIARGGGGGAELVFSPGSWRRCSGGNVSVFGPGWESLTPGWSRQHVGAEGEPQLRSVRRGAEPRGERLRVSRQTHWQRGQSHRLLPDRKGRSTFSGSGDRPSPGITLEPATSVRAGSLQSGVAGEGEGRGGLGLCTRAQVVVVVVGNKAGSVPDTETRRVA